ncbi:retropepsin-like domain-containing protein [Massilia sp. IC2-476]|uniref:retropepsin-like domain-containing protein n=1 Tax=Massilia sp. IC2-476 TaxID=2887199 RepID=UPI001D11280E|nr:retropepsin-like domain-containing protein [Massilia sp. IC2-476]MCC2974898.1 retropepsin-like domain-containing protein [Massilia sp. IC2-476]
MKASVPTSLIRYTVCAGLVLSQAAFAQSPSPGCRMGAQATIALSFTDDLRPVSQALIGGASVPVMLSTGSAESIVFNKKVLDRLGIPVRTTTSKLFASDARNDTGVDIVRDTMIAPIRDFSFGLTKGKNGEFFVEDFLDDTYGVRIGAATLLKQDLEVALDAGYLKLFQPDGCFRDHLAYWDPQAVAVMSMGDPWKRDARVVFNLHIGGQRVTALLSTSTPQSYLPRAAGVRLGLSPESPGAVREDPLPGDKADKPVWKVPVPQLFIGSLEVKDFDLRLMDLPQSGELLVLGADFLHRHRVYIAMSQQKIYFSPITAPRVMKRGKVDVIPQPLD